MLPSADEESELWYLSGTEGCAYKEEGALVSKIRDVPQRELGSCHCSVDAENSQESRTSALSREGSMVPSYPESCPDPDPLSANSPCLQCLVSGNIL